MLKRIAFHFNFVLWDDFLLSDWHRYIYNLLQADVANFTPLFI